MLSSKELCFALLRALDVFLGCDGMTASDRDNLHSLHDEVKLALRTGAVRESTVCQSRTGSAFDGKAAKRLLRDLAAVASATLPSLRKEIARLQEHVSTTTWHDEQPSNDDVRAGFERAIAAALMPDECASHPSSSARASARSETTARDSGQVGKLANLVIAQLCESDGGTDVDG